MSVDKLVDSTQLDADLASVADAIRTKGGTSASLAFPAEFVSAIQAIPTGGGMPVSVLNHEAITPTSNITSANAITLNLTPCANFLIMGYVEDDISAESITQYWFSARGFGISALQIGGIMRADGTQGTDASGLSYNSSTGVFKIPNTSYSNLIAGKTYHFWLFKIGGAA